MNKQQWIVVSWEVIAHVGSQMKVCLVVTRESATLLNPSSWMSLSIFSSFSLWRIDFRSRKAAEKRRSSRTVSVPMTTSSCKNTRLSGCFMCLTHDRALSEHALNEAECIRTQLVWFEIRLNNHWRNSDSWSSLNTRPNSIKLYLWKENKINYWMVSVHLF